MKKLEQEYEGKLRTAQSRVTEVEEEMRILLIETENNKKQFEEKFKELQGGLN